MFKHKNLLNYLKYIKIAIIGLFLVLVAVQAGKSFVLDEIDFPTVSNATSQSGRPVYYHSEQSPDHVGTYHPTLYINALATFIRAFGFSEITIRAFGAICVLVTAYLLILIYRQLTKKDSKWNEGIETLFLGLYLLNPYTIANATLPDIDPTVLPILFLLFIYISIKYLFQKRLMNNRVVTMLGLLFAVVLWSKLTTPLVLPFFLVALAVITSKDYKKSVLFTLKVVATGALVFVVTYFLYCILLNLSPTYTYGFLVASFTKGTSSTGPLVGVINNLGNFAHFIYWPTVPVIGVLGVSVIGLLADKKKDEQTKIKKLLVVTAILTTLFYIALISPFGGFFKYPFPVFGILILTVILFYERYLKGTKINVFYASGAVVVGYLADKLFWKDSMFLTSGPFGYLIPLVVLVVACYILLLKTSTQKVTASVFVLFIFFAIGFQLSISRIQAVAPYPTKYLYGQSGMNEAADYLRVHTKSNEVIWSMKDIGYYVNYRYVESYEYYFSKPLEKDLAKMIDEGKVRYYVATTGIGEDNLDYYTDIKEILDTHAVREKQFGNFIIYKSKNAVEE